MTITVAAMKYFLPLAVLLLLPACSDADSESEKDSDAPHFMDQPVQGSINGHAISAFSLQSYEASTFFEGRIDIDLCEAAPADGRFFCDYAISISVPAEVGVHPLVEDGSYYGTLLDASSDSPLNIIVDTGWVEILSLDLDAGIVEGRIDASGSGDSVNGDFRAENPDAPDFTGASGVGGAGGAGN